MVDIGVGSSPSSTPKQLSNTVEPRQTVTTGGKLIQYTGLHYIFSMSSFQSDLHPPLNSKMTMFSFLDPVSQLVSEKSVSSIVSVYNSILK